MTDDTPKLVNVKAVGKTKYSIGPTDHENFIKSIMWWLEGAGYRIAGPDEVVLKPHLTYEQAQIAYKAVDWCMEDSEGNQIEQDEITTIIQAFLFAMLAEGERG